MRKNLLFLFLSSLLFYGCSSSTEPELHLYVWADFIKPELIEQFEKENNCRVVVDTFDSNESMYAKLKLGASGYDIVFPSNYIFDIMYGQGMLETLDPAKLPNRKYIYPKYEELLGETGQTYGVPYLLTFTGLGIRKDKVSHFEPSWNIFARTDLKGRMTMLNDIREVMGASLKYLGYSINTINEKEVKEAAEQVLKWKKNLAKFESEQYKHGIADAEYLAVQGYGGDLMQVIKENPQVEFVLPNEGTMMSLDIMAICKNAPNMDLAHKFINFLLEPQAAADNVAFTMFSPANEGAYEKLPKDLKNNPALFPPAIVLEKSEIIKNLGTAVELYNKAWDFIKS